MAIQRYLQASRRTGVLLALGGTAFAAPAAHAQYNASIQGTVTDTQGALIAGATVVLTNTETNQVTTHTTSGAGVYTFNQLPPSLYSISVTAKGFVSKRLDHVQVTPEQANAVNVQLSAGAETQTVTVSGNQAAALDTETATISGTVTSNQIQHLPSFGRDVFQLAQLAPGTFGDGAQAAGGGTSSLPSSNRSGSAASDGIFTTENAPQISGDGGQNEANGISINGISTVSAVWGGASVITPSEDSVKDVHIVSNGYDASNGRFSAAQVQVVTKNGTNQVHGSAFFKADRPGLNAYQRYNSPGSLAPGRPGVQRDNSRFNQFGGTLGGPILKNRIFAFFSYEGLRNNTSNTSTGWYEAPQFLALAQQGTIASQYLTYPGEGASYSAIIPQTCGDLGLQEDTNCRTLSDGTLNLGSPRTGAIPGTLDPTYGGGSSNPGVGDGLTDTPTIAFLNTVDPTNVVEDQYSGRMDVNPGSKDLVTFSIYWVPQTETYYNGPVRAANLWHHDAVNDAFAGIWDHTFSANLLNEARVNAAGYRWNEVATNPQAPFGLPEAIFDSLGSMTSSTSISDHYFGAASPSDLDQWTYGYEDTLTKVFGKSQVKIGGGATRLYYLNNQVATEIPTYSFRNPWDFLNDAPYEETGSFNPITGTPTSNRQDIRSQIYSGFVQDDIKLKPNLTVNLGIRWTYFGSIASKENNLSVLKLGTGAAALTGASFRVGGSLYDPQKLNFGPQLGFAWSPEAQESRLVFRGGFGLNFNQEEIAIASNGANNPPESANVSFCCSTAAALNPDILYATSSSPTALTGYPSNPNTISTFNTANIPISGGPVTAYGYPSNLPTNYVYHYSFDTQYELAKNIVATVGYQGSVARHLIREYNENVVAGAEGLALNPRLQTVNFYGNDSNSNYNALLTTLTHRFSQQFQAEAQYTWSKSMDEGSQPFYEDPYPYDNRLAYGRSDYNVTDAFKFFGMYQPIFFRGSNDSWAEKLIGGWSISGILNIHSGFPWTPEFNNTGGNVYYQGSTYGSLRPAAYLGGAGHNTSNKAFISGPGYSSATASTYNSNYPQGALNYFPAPAFVPGPQFGDGIVLPPPPGIERNTQNGPNYIDADMTLSKSFGLPNNRILGEGSAVEVRADAYNIYNRLNLTNVNTIISTTDASGNNISNPSFGQAQNALGSRTIELQARFSF